MHRLVWQYFFPICFANRSVQYAGHLFSGFFFHHVHFVYPSVQLFRGLPCGQCGALSLFLRCVVAGLLASVFFVLCKIHSFHRNSWSDAFPVHIFREEDSAVYGHGLLPTAWNAIFPPSHTDVVCLTNRDDWSVHPSVWQTDYECPYLRGIHVSFLLRWADSSGRIVGIGPIPTNRGRRRNVLLYSSRRSICWNFRLRHLLQG